MIDLVDRAGNVGLGEWRPERDGTFGTFYVSRHISDREEIEEVVRECMAPLIPLTIPEWALDMEIDPTLLAKVMNAHTEGRLVEEDEAERVVDELDEDAEKKAVG